MRHVLARGTGRSLRISVRPVELEIVGGEKREPEWTNAFALEPSQNFRDVGGRQALDSNTMRSSKSKLTSRRHRR
jgi:hypothetical protein